MTITTPLSLASFADLLKFASVSFKRKENDVFSGLGTGQILAANVAPKMWMADVKLAKMYHQAARQVQALIEALDGAAGTFYLYDPLGQYPQSDPTGSILGANTVTISTLNSNNKALRLTGLPAAYVLTVGDMMAFDYASGTKRALHRIVETTTASGGGLSPEFEVRPHLRTGVTTGLTVLLKKPAGKFIMLPDSFDVGTDDNLKTTSIQFTAMQVP